MREVKRIENTARDKRLLIYEGESGRFYFHVEERRAVDDYLREHGAPDEHWAWTKESGLYASAEDAERDARQTLTWLREPNDK